jgi:hypothetical protein
MVVTGYFDESGTHSGSQISAVAGFVSAARGWRKFEKRATKLFKRFGVDVFHTIDVRRTDKDFGGWSVNRKIDFLDEFQHIINETAAFGAAAFIAAEDYAYYRALVWPRKARPDSKYAILFRACLGSAIENVTTMGLASEPFLKTVLEDGHVNANDALRVYNTAKLRLGESRALSGLTFANKKACLPLAAADLFAYTAWGKEVGQRPIGIANRPTKADASYRGNMYRIMIDRDILDSLHAQAVDFGKDRT